MEDDDNEYFKKTYNSMDVEQLNRLTKILNEDGKALIATELRRREAIVSINDILEQFGFEITDLYEELVNPKIREIVEGKYERPIKRRKESFPRYRLSGKNYDGRQARRAKEFAEFVKNGRIDVDLVVKKGALNPKWLDEQEDRVLFSLGIDDLEKYKSKHGM